MDAHKLAYSYIDIKQAPPSAKELKAYYQKSGLPLKKFFNTSGISYREQNIKEKFDTESEADLIKRLSQDGMLIKRPLLVTDNVVLTGFKEATWQDVLEQKQ